jgi:hypothetical protein
MSLQTEPQTTWELEQPTKGFFVEGLQCFLNTTEGAGKVSKCRVALNSTRKQQARRARATERS